MHNHYLCVERYTQHTALTEQRLGCTYMYNWAVITINFFQQKPAQFIFIALLAFFVVVVVLFAWPPTRSFFFLLLLLLLMYININELRHRFISLHFIHISSHFFRSILPSMVVAAVAANRSVGWKKINKSTDPRLNVNRNECTINGHTYTHSPSLWFRCYTLFFILLLFLQLLSVRYYFYVFIDSTLYWEMWLSFAI